MNLVFQANTTKLSRFAISSSNDALAYLKNVYPPGKLDAQEMFVVLYMNVANQVIGHDVIAYGGITTTVADFRLIIQKALLMLATGIIISHNHPSGSLQPSQADQNLTKKLMDALKILDISLLDHLILSDANANSFFSFADNGLI
ncbi:MAG: JAB domain-containing protein [Planktothrix sp.]